jgi:hypothetical protein
VSSLQRLENSRLTNDFSKYLVERKLFYPPLTWLPAEAFITFLQPVFGLDQILRVRGSFHSATALSHSCWYVIGAQKCM